MEELLNQLISVGVGLGILAGAWFIWFLSGVVNWLFSNRKWSWKRMFEDIVKTLVMALAILSWVVLINVIDWYTAKLGLDVSAFLDGANVVGLIAIIIGGSANYALKAFKNFASFIGESHVAKVTGNQDYAGVAEDVKEFVETITSMTSKEDIENSVDTSDAPELQYVDVTDDEAGRGGVNNTYPEPYRSAAQDSMTDPSTCYNREAQPAGTLITLENGSYKAVEDLVVGDRLWNHDGSEVVTVKSIWKTKKPVYNIRTGLGDIRFTGEHPLYTRRNKWKALARGDLKAFGDPQFVKTKDLHVGDKILAPTLKGQSLGLTPNELKWLGFYLGDGTKSTKSDKCPVYRLIVADGRKREYVDSLGIEGSYSVHSKSEKAKHFTLAKKAAPILRKTLDTINDKSFGALVIPEDAKYIVEGYLEADGCNLGNGLYSASSTDKKLLLAIQRMVLSIGGTMSIHKCYDGGELEKFGTTVYAKTCWGANINLNPCRRQIHEFKDGKYATITKITKGTEKEEVYNIEVSGSHTYIADNHGVHNCVSYTAWKIKELTGKWPTRTGGMNAKNWVERLAENGYKNVVAKPVNGGKYVGVSAAGTYGHVVWFEEGETVSEYNYSVRGGFSVRIVNLAAYKWVEIKAPATTTPAPTPAKKEEPKKEEAKPAPAKEDNTVSYTYQKGDDFGSVVVKLGLRTSHGLWGDDGDVAYYDKQLAAQGITGNIPIGTTIKLTPRV